MTIGDVTPCRGIPGRQSQCHTAHPHLGGVGTRVGVGWGGVGVEVGPFQCTIPNAVGRAGEIYTCIR